MTTNSTCSSARSEHEEHNIWNPVLGLFGQPIEDILTAEELGRVVLSCCFALDLSCYQVATTPLVTESSTIACNCWSGTTASGIDLL